MSKPPFCILMNLRLRFVYWESEFARGRVSPVQRIPQHLHQLPAGRFVQRLPRSPASLPIDALGYGRLHAPKAVQFRSILQGHHFLFELLIESTVFGKGVTEGGSFLWFDESKAFRSWNGCRVGQLKRRKGN